VAAALGVRVYLHHRALQAASEAAEAAMARDTYGGFREADQTLAPLVVSGSTDTKLVALRSFALAEIAARYGDDQAGVEADLLLMPLERQGSSSPRVYASRALLLLAGGEPGSALTALGRAPENTEELSIIRARIADKLDRPDLAQAAIAETLASAEPPVEALYTAGNLASQGRQYRNALDLYQRALRRNPQHVPSVVAIADLSVAGRYRDPKQARDLVNRSLGGLVNEASAGEMCRIYLDLAQLDLESGLIAEAPQMLDRAAEVDDAPAACRLPLARLNLRLGRRKAALEILEKAAADDDSGEVSLVLVQSLTDWQKALEWLDRPAPPELTPAQLAVWGRHAHALKLSALSALGRRPQASQLLDEMTGEDFIDALIGVARYHAFFGDSPEIQRLLSEAKTRAAQSGDIAPDELSRVGEAALALRAYSVAASACGESAQLAAANYRALVCLARGLAGVGRGREAIGALDRALALNPESGEALSLKSSLALASPASGSMHR
jgi:tetratricopeptide (TPR) repeat protein